MTLLEVIIAMSILIMLGVLSISSFIASRNVRDLSTSGGNVLSMVRTAQSHTLAGKDNSQWGVRFEITQYILFRGSSFGAATFTEAFSLPSSIEIVNINLGGGQEVVFTRIEGKAAQPGTFDVRVKNAPINIFPITVESSGQAYQTGSVSSPTGTRIVDTRHRAFNLGWSIKTAVALTLTFSNPPGADVVYPVVMAPYFDAGPTKFDWAGTVLVGGGNEIVRIHTTSLSDADTVLSIDRDCRNNSKKVVISIDAKTIATYEADCQTVTVGVFGGTMTEP